MLLISVVSRDPPEMGVTTVKSPFWLMYSLGESLSKPMTLGSAVRYVSQ